MLVYVDNIMLTGDDTQSIANVKIALAKQFMIKDLNPLQYFLKINVAHNKRGIVLSQRKYETNLLRETKMLGSKPTNIPMNPKTHIYDCKGKEVDTQCYTIVTNYYALDISLAVEKLS